MAENNLVLDAIFSRRSVRDYLDKPVPREIVEKVLLAGIWAPSGLNNQPWRFAIVRDKSVKSQIARLTRYRAIIEKAPLIIAVFIDRESMYNEVKDHQAIGACIENMLLAVHSLGLGAVWLGEILKNAEEVRNILGLQETVELMAVVALGYPAHRKQKSSRKSLDEFILKEI